MKLLLPADYPAFLEEIKASIRTAQVKTALAVNAGMLQLYWDIGRRIVEKQRQEGWETKIIAHLTADLQNAFPALAGFSHANIYRMRAFYLAWSGQPPVVARSVRQLGRKIVAQPVGQSPPQPLPQPVTQLPWGYYIRRGAQEGEIMTTRARQSRKAKLSNATFSVLIGLPVAPNTLIQETKARSLA